MKNSKTMLFFVLLLGIYSADVFAREENKPKWQGVDESVIEKFAKEKGREPRSPFINTDQGDLLLFVFLIAGVVGGFIGGYCWRIIIAEKGRGAKSGE